MKPFLIILCAILPLVTIRFINAEEITEIICATLLLVTTRLINAEEIIPGSDKTTLSNLEKVLKNLALITGLNTNKTFYSGPLNAFKNYVHLMIPGARWCGDGEKVKFDDEWAYSEVDKCCGKHDHCNDDILAGDIKLNLLNNGIFTRSSCYCDREFYNCLKNLGKMNFRAATIGYTYFTILRPQCFETEIFEIRCILYSDDGDKCIEDEKVPISYNWFDNPTF